METKEIGVHVIMREGVIVGFFTRDEVSNKNIIYTSTEASLDEINALFTKERKI